MKANSKLNKAQEKRLDETIRLINESLSEMMTELSKLDKAILKQHLADQLALQKKEIIEKLEKRKVSAGATVVEFNDGTLINFNDIRGFNTGIDQAIESIQ